MSIHIDDLRELAGSAGYPFCDEVADEIEQLERENAALTAELAEYERTVAHMRDGARLQDSATAAVMEHAERLERENAALTARAAELERDAGRYRFLRKRDVTFEAEDGPCFVSYTPELDHDGSNLDQSIDAAMRGTE